MESAMPVQQSEARSSFVSSPVESKPDGKGVMYLLMAFLVILVLGLVGIVAYLLFFKDVDTGGNNGGNGGNNADDGGTVVQTCTYDGKTYVDGESFPATDGCNTCSCSNGSVACTEIACQTDEDSGEEGNQVANREFVVEYWEGDGGAITLQADLPIGATLEKGNYTNDIWGTSVGTKIIVDNFELFFTIPHMGGIYTYDDHVDQLNSEYIPNLYRVIAWKDGEYTGTKFYVVDPTLTGICDNPFGDDVEAPCGDLQLKFEGEEGISSVFVRYSGVDEKTVQADAIMETLRFVSE